MRFLLDNDVDHTVASRLRTVGHDVVAASEVDLGGATPASDDEVTVYAIERGMVVVTHDREFTARRKRHTIGLHIRLMCTQPDAVDVLHERHDELLDVLSWTDAAVIEVYTSGVYAGVGCRQFGRRSRQARSLAAA